MVVRIGGGWEPFREFLIRHKYKHKASDMKLSAQAEEEVQEFMGDVASEVGVYQKEIKGVGTVTANTHLAHETDGFGDWR